MKSTSYGFKADVFSFGIILWQLLVWRPRPYEHILSNLEVASAVLAGQRPSVASLSEETDAAFIQLAQDCWSMEPSQRPSFEDVLLRLRVMGGGGGGGGGITPVEEEPLSEHDPLSDKT